MGAYQVVFTPYASGDVEEIVRYIARDNPEAALPFFAVGAIVNANNAVLSEEGLDDKARLTANRVWIVDPLDGTREFGEEGRTDWAVHVALWERNNGDAGAVGELTAGAVALPAQHLTLSTLNAAKRPERRGDFKIRTRATTMAISTRTRCWTQTTTSTAL